MAKSRDDLTDLVGGPFLASPGPRSFAPQEEGPFRGRGPAGWRRPDELIYDDVNERLTLDPFLDATGVRVSVCDGVVTLEGAVRGRESRLRAELLADGVAGVKIVHNELRYWGQWGDPHQDGIGPTTGVPRR